MYITHVPERVSIKGYKRSDCTVTAIGNALGLSYDLSKKILQTAEPGGHDSDELNFRKSKPRTKADFTRTYFVEKLCSSLSESEINYKERKLKVPFDRFAKENPKGLYLILSRSHIATCFDGKLIDSWDSRKLPIEIAYEVDINKARKIIENLAKFYKMNDSIHIRSDYEKMLFKKTEEPLPVNPDKKLKVFGQKKSSIKI